MVLLQIDPAARMYEIHKQLGSVMANDSKHKHYSECYTLELQNLLSKSYADDV